MKYWLKAPEGQLLQTDRAAEQCHAHTAAPGSTAEIVAEIPRLAILEWLAEAREPIHKAVWGCFSDALEPTSAFTRSGRAGRPKNAEIRGSKRPEAAIGECIE